MRKALFTLLMLTGILLSACSAPTATTATNTPAPTLLVLPTQAVTPSPALPTLVVTQPPGQAPTAVPTLAPPQPAATVPATAVSPSQSASPTPSGSSSVTTVDVSAQEYIDDRSGATQLIASLFNAINRKEYLRAYSYWEPTGQINGTSFAAYQAGYATTQSVQVIVGQVTGDAGAGNFYYSVPVGLTAQNSDGSIQKFAGCYLLHQANPGVQGTLPFQSLGIQAAEVHALQSSQDPAGQLASACSSDRFNAGHALPPQPSFAAADISAARYLDDRSDPVQVLRSLYNAINRSEYLRAYSYWEPAAAKTQLGSLAAYSNGFSDTQSVQLATGQVTSNAGAGQVYYNVPITLVAKTRSGAAQTFVGCYTLHLSSPQIQATPPFQPLAVSAAKVQQVDNTANTATLMTSACQQ